MSTNLTIAIRSANASAAITPAADPISGNWLSTLPAVVASGAAGASQVNVGDTVTVYNQGVPIGPSQVVDSTGHLFGTVLPGLALEFVATSALTWALLSGVKDLAVLNKVANGAVAVTVTSLGPTAIGTTTISGWVKVALPDGTVGYMPFWK